MLTKLEKTRADLLKQYNLGQISKKKAVRLFKTAITIYLKLEKNEASYGAVTCNILK